VSSDTALGKLPAEWKELRLGELLTRAQYGLSVRGNGQGAYPILRMTNQVAGRVVARDLQFADIGRAEFEKFRVEPGTGGAKSGAPCWDAGPRGATHERWGQ
jgi:hypothetical protein